VCQFGHHPSGEGSGPNVQLARRKFSAERKPAGMRPARRITLSSEFELVPRRGRRTDRIVVVRTEQHTSRMKLDAVDLVFAGVFVCIAGVQALAYVVLLAAA
jgi:hypothetical protein